MLYVDHVQVLKLARSSGHPIGSYVMCGLVEVACGRKPNYLVGNVTEGMSIYWQAEVLLWVPKDARCRIRMARARSPATMCDSRSTCGAMVEQQDVRSLGPRGPVAFIWIDS